MMRILCFGLILLFACNNKPGTSAAKRAKYAAQIMQVERLIQYASVCDSLGVQSMFGDDFEDVGLYESNINSAVVQLYGLLKKHGTPGVDTYRFIQYGKKHPRLVDIVISFPGSKTKKFLVEFIKHQPSNEIFNFTEAETIIDPGEPTDVE